LSEIQSPSLQLRSPTLKLRAFIAKSLPQGALGIDYDKCLLRLGIAADEKDVLSAKKVCMDLAKIEAAFTETPILAFGRGSELKPLILRTGFVAGAQAFAKQADDATARRMLAYLLPKTEVASYFIPAGKAGYTLSIDANGKVTRTHETSSLTATLRGLKMQSAKLEDMSPDQLQLLRKAWLEARANVEKQGSDAEVLALIGDEISRIDKKLEEAMVIAGKTKAQVWAEAKKAKSKKKD